ncbi:acyltransferase family protein [Cellulomonas bogoriensis]|uniref:Acyltransferase n=1 Tax=Cellulomonas bogoriensis 69B4 = DSM 16987 TaxID=1386082 RepID=A0A0A0BY15_9CELL|nr:acyltransferase family protein [Cellulomonas bogoriensis]KGM13253.1 acyltransferase [Cellulomonas bogoriensis 69B4 = DSM 16987]
MTGPAAPAPHPTTTTTTRFRPELHGVRGFALALVVVFHVVGNGRVSGGIDVFLAVTGFLFTQSLLRRMVERGRIDARSHYLRLARRLLPPLVTVTLAVAVAAVVVLPSTQWHQLSRELVASVLYYENWELIASQLTYDAAGPASSPLQHIWSLSVQGQFHLLWPALIALTVWGARRAGVPARAATIAVVATVLAGSMAYAVHLTGTNQEVAYLHTGTRMWELALGGLAGLLLADVRLPRGWRIGLGWVGLVMISTAGLVFDGARDFPGPAALWPIGGLILVLAAGTTGARWSADALLATRPLRFVADISYSLYLWHWPVLVLFLAYLDRERVGARGAVVVLTVSVLLAWATKVLVEDRVNGVAHRLPGRAPVSSRWVLVGAGATALVFATSAAGHEVRQSVAVAQLQSGAVSQPGAAALAADPDLSGAPVVSVLDSLVPSLEAIRSDKPGIYEHGCIQDVADEPAFDAVLVCDPDPAQGPPRVVMTGGSHVQQWWTAMHLIAVKHGWELVVVEKNGCQLGADRDPTYSSQSCRRWNTEAFGVIVDLEPDVVLTLGSTTRNRVERTPDFFVDVWRDLGDHGVPVLAIRDTVRLVERAPDCIAEHGPDAIRCGTVRAEVLDEHYLEDVDVPDNVTPLDMTPYLCTSTHCPAIVGGVIVYRDASHVTSTYMHTLAPYLEQELLTQAPWLFERD